MNFKAMIFIFGFLIISGCGVKGDPINPPGTELKDWYKTYTGNDSEEGQKK